MKIIFSMLLLLVGVIFTLPTQAQVATQSTSEETAVKKVIEDDTQGFMTRNEQKWSNAWAHTAYVSWSSERSPGQVLGWENLKQAFTYNFVSGQPNRPALNFKRENYKVTISDNLATATFVQIALNAEGNAIGKTNEIRALEKVGSEWKIIYVYSRTIDR